jgi:hypothetical protein
MVTPVVKNFTTKVSTDDSMNWIDIMSKINLILLAIILFGVCIVICVSGINWCKGASEHQVTTKL